MVHPWLILAPNDNQHYLDNIFQNVNLRLDSNVKIVVTDNNFSIWTAYNLGFHLGKKTIFAKIGTATSRNFYLYDNQSFFLQRQSLRGLTLRVGSVTLFSDPTKTFEEYMFDTRLKHLDTMSKFHYPMLLLLEDFHNFSYDSMLALSNSTFFSRHTIQIREKWFGDYQNGTDGGLGKLLYDDKIDITGTGASQRPPRIDAYDYLMPSYHFRPCYIFRNPGTHKLFSNVFLTPFSEKVWYVILAFLLLVCLLLKAFYQIEGSFYGLRKKLSWATAMLITICPLLNQGGWTYPTSHAGRFLFIVLLFFAILLYNYYTSSILSSLLSNPPQAFHTLDELGHSKLDMGVENVPYAVTWFNIINDSDVQYIYKHKIFPPGAKDLNFFTAEEGMEKVRKGGFAYHTQLDTGYPIVAKTFDQNAICDISNIPMIPQVFAGIMVRKKSQYKELFHIALRMMKQAGLIHRISKIWEADKPLCLSSIRVVAVGIEQTFMAFVVLFLGIVLSAFILVIEIFWFKFKLDNLKIC